MSRENPPRNVAELSETVRPAWRNLPQNTTNRLVLSMPRRVTALLNARGAYTRYWLLFFLLYQINWALIGYVIFLLLIYQCLKGDDVMFDCASERGVRSPDD